MFNPYPGLRAFEAEEDHLFFGREREVDELLRRLRSTRFLAVVGTSGSGKSSLVRCGLISALYGGFMVTAGSGWRVAKFRPSEDPIGNLAASLGAPDVLGADAQLGSSNRLLVETTLRRGALGLIDAVSLSRLPQHENLLVVVDQFEELFRFRRSRHIQNAKDEAIAFIKLLLEATRHKDVPIYVALTMRSDFIGECMDYPGLPEAITAGQYLIPRLTRDELRAAITGPAAVGGGKIAARLVLRLLNELGDDQDQLPVLQHALMRTWAYWERSSQSGEAIDITHYEAIGTLRSALSLHAEEAYQETGSDRNRLTAERIFKALTDTFSDPRGVRRPTSVQDLAVICNVPEAEILEIVETFRSPERCFLTPPFNVPLESRSIIDLSHESLMRCWTRLIAWAEQERVSAVFYIRLSKAAAWYEEGTSGLWRDPELELGLEWRRKNQPTAAWAERYNPCFDPAIRFLEFSATERERQLVEAERARRKKLREYQWAAAVLGCLLLGVGILAYVARRETTLAQKNLNLAQNAVKEMLLSAGREKARVAADVPQMEEFRKELLSKAKNFYGIFITEKPDSETLRSDKAEAYFGLGDIDRLLQEPQNAADEYKEAIAQFEALVRDYPRKPEYRQTLANSYNWLGETLRTDLNMQQDAGNAYDSALRLQQQLLHDSPDNPEYRRELARTYYNRGILRSVVGNIKSSDSDFREARDLLTPLTQNERDLAAMQELARVYNDLGNLLIQEDRFSEAQELYQRAIGIHETLMKKDPGNREYKQELATFNNNFTMLFLDQRQLQLAEQKNRVSLHLLEDLAAPSPSLRSELVSAHNLRCQLLASGNVKEAEYECQQSLNLLKTFDEVPALQSRIEFQTLFRDLGYNYLELAKIDLSSGSVADAQSNVEKLRWLLPKISEPDRGNIVRSLSAITSRIAN